MLYSAATAGHLSDRKTMKVGLVSGDKPAVLRQAINRCFVTIRDVPPTPVAIMEHRGDRATLDVIRLTLERLGTRPVIVIGALRPPEVVRGSLLGDALGGRGVRTRKNYEKRDKVRE